MGRWEIATCTCCGGLSAFNQHLHHIRQFRSLLGTLPFEVGAGFEQLFLDLVGVADEFAVDGEEGSELAGDMWGGHAGAAHFHIEFFHALFAAQRFVAARQDALARCDDVGFLPAVCGGAA